MTDREKIVKELFKLLEDFIWHIEKFLGADKPVGKIKAICKDSIMCFFKESVAGYIIKREIEARIDEMAKLRYSSVPTGHYLDKRVAELEKQFKEPTDD